MYTLQRRRKRQLVRNDLRKVSCTRRRTDSETVLTSLLVESCRKGDISLVRYFLSEHAHLVNRPHSRRTTPLIAACEQNLPSVVGLLLRAGANPAHPAADGWTPLMECAEKGNVECAKALLETIQPISAVSEIISAKLFPDGWTPLLVACHYGKDEMCKFLLDHGANPCLECTTNGWAALMSASYGGWNSIVKMLLDHGADPAQTKDDGGHALMCASYKGHLDVCRTLLEAGSDPNKPMLGEVTSLMLAAEEGHLHVCRLLCLFGADILANSTEGESALSIARSNGQIRTEPFNLSQVDRSTGGGDLRVLSSFLEDTVSRSPFLRAVEARDQIVLKQILRSDVRISNNAATTAYELSLCTNHPYSLPVDHSLVGMIRNALHEPWTPASHALFPETFRRKAEMLLTFSSSSHCGGSGTVSLPRDVWTAIFAFLHRYD